MIEAALILSAVLQFADVATTLWILGHGGVEKNPIMARLMAHLGARVALAAKVVFVLVLLAGGWWWGAFHQVPVVAYVIAAMSIAVVVNNVVVIAKMRRRA